MTEFIVAVAAAVLLPLFLERNPYRLLARSHDRPFLRAAMEFAFLKFMEHASD